MILDAVSHNYPGILPPNTWANDGTISVGETWGITSLVLRIRELTQGEACLDLLRIWSHGNAGEVHIGTGLYANTALNLRPLRRLFRSNAQGVEIHACGVASATDLCKPNRGTECVVGPGTEGGFAGHGYRLLRAIADATGVPARAPVHAQNAAVNFVGLGSYQGPTVEVHP